MSTTQHTPGPWVVGRIVNDAGIPLGDFAILGTDGIAFGFVGDENEDCPLANARLIAAAPDLLKALKAVMPLTLRFDAPCQSGVVEQSECLHCQIVAQSLAVIAKAEGK